MAQNTKRKPKPWFTENGWLNRKFPKACIEDCAHQGDCCDDCERWVRELPGFEESIHEVRTLAENWIREYGAWDYETEIKAFSDFDLAVRVLWIAAGDIKEQGEWFGLVH